MALNSSSDWTPYRRPRRPQTRRGRRCASQALCSRGWRRSVASYAGNTTCVSRNRPHCWRPVLYYAVHCIPCTPDSWHWPLRYAYWQTSWPSLTRTNRKSRILLTIWLLAAVAQRLIQRQRCLENQTLVCVGSVWLLSLSWPPIASSTSPRATVECLLPTTPCRVCTARWSAVGTWTRYLVHSQVSVDRKLEVRLTVPQLQWEFGINTTCLEVVFIVRWSLFWGGFISAVVTQQGSNAQWYNTSLIRTG